MLQPFNLYLAAIEEGGVSITCPPMCDRLTLGRKKEDLKEGGNISSRGRGAILALLLGEGGRNPLLLQRVGLKGHLRPAVGQAGFESSQGKVEKLTGIWAIFIRRRGKEELSAGTKV